MNLFLLTAVPLAAVALHLYLYPERRGLGPGASWAQGAVWALASLVVCSFFGKWREFSGDLGLAFLGLTFTDVLLVPGVTVAAWALVRRGRDPWELGLWLALALGFAGVRDFVATDRLYDLGELFLVPLGRIFVLVAVPLVWGWVVGATKPGFGLRVAALVGLTLAGSIVPVLSFAGWGWLAWVLVVGGIAAILWFQGAKKTAPRGSGSVL